MSKKIYPSKTSVLLLFNLDPDWVYQDRQEALEAAATLEQAICGIGYKTTLIPVTSSDLDFALSGYEPLDHIVFNWCEGLPGVPHSEWLVAEYLERRGFIFTGASADNLALAQDKCRVKHLLQRSGIPTPYWQTHTVASSVPWGRFPAIVKPSREHCSEGIDRNAVCMTEAELKSRINYVLERYHQPALVEDFIDGREFHVSLWGNGAIEVLPPVEMEFSMFDDQHDRICSYEAKFVPGSVPYQNIRTILPAPLSKEEFRSLSQISISAYAVTGCRDYARIDIRMKDGVFYVIDINPNSDISPDTSTILASDYLGYSYGEFGGRIISLAAHRHPIFGNRPRPTLVND